MKDLEISKWTSFLRKGVRLKPLSDMFKGSPASPVIFSPKWYMKDISITVTSGDFDHYSSTLLKLDVFDSEVPGPSHVLNFERISASEWKYEGTVVLRAADITLVTGWDETENIGFVHIIRSELEELSDNTAHITRELLTEEDGPHMRLRCVVENVPPERDLEELGGKYPTYEVLAQDLSQNQMAVFSWVLSRSSKPQLFEFIGDNLRERFHETGDQRDIHISVLAYSICVQLIPIIDSEHRSYYLCNYGMSLHQRYLLTGSLQDIDEAVSSLRKAVQSTAEGSENLPTFLAHLAIALQERFKRTENISDISEAIIFQQKSVQLAPDGHADLPRRLNVLAKLFETRFKRTKDLNDISEAILSQHRSVQLTPGNHADLPIRFNFLGYLLETRYWYTEDLGDISEAIKSQKKVVHLTRSHVGQPAYLNKLGQLLQKRFSHTNDLDDISEAISSLQKSVQLTSEGDEDLATRLNRLGVSFQARFDLTGDLADISSAISFQQQSIQLASEGFLDLPNWRESLAVSFQKRFEYTEDLKDLYEAVLSQRECIDLTPEGHKDLPSRLSFLAYYAETYHEHTSSPIAIGEAIRSQRKAVQLTAESHADHSIYLETLVRLQKSSSDHSHVDEDLSALINSQRELVRVTPGGHVDLPNRLINLAMSLQQRFRVSKNIADITEAVTSHRKAVQLTPNDDTDLPIRLINLGMSLQTRFRATGNLADISEAIISQRESVQITPTEDEYLPARLNCLGMLLRERFEHTPGGDLADISEALLFHKQSIKLTPEDNEELPISFHNIGNCYRSRFNVSRGLADISEAIQSHRKCALITPKDNPYLPARLNNLGISLQARFQLTGDLVDISEAITSQNESVRLDRASKDFPARFRHITRRQKENDVSFLLEDDLSFHLDCLGHSHRLLFMRTECLSDISEAIIHHRESVMEIPGHVNHPAFPGRLSSLGTSLHNRYVLTGDLADLSEAIVNHQKSVHLTPDTDVDLPRRLHNLGISLRARFWQYTRSLTDISEAVICHRKAVERAPQSHASYSVYLAELGLAVRMLCEHTGSISGLTEAIEIQRKVLEMAPERDNSLPSRLTDLGRSLFAQFRFTGNLADISQAIEVHQKSVALTPDGHHALPHRLDGLGMALQARFSCTSDLADISEAIFSHLKSVQLTPNGHRDLPIWLGSTGDAFAARYELMSDAKDIENAVLHYRLASTATSGVPSVRLSAAEKWVKCAQKLMDKSQVFEAYQTAISLIPQVADLSQIIENRYSNLIDISKLSASAAAAAMNMDRHDLAVEWLEQGRCLVWSQLNDLRAPIDDLRADYPDLADQIRTLAVSLEDAGSRGRPNETTLPSFIFMRSMEDEGRRYIENAKKWDQLLLQVRAIPQFSDFLRPPSCSSLLQRIPKFGYVVVINIHQSRSDALVLTSGAKEPLHIALPDFPYEKADSFRQDLKTLLHDSGIRMRQSEHDIDVTRGSRRHVRGVAHILRELWLSVAKPILEGLGYSTPTSELPRIWWCVTGPLAFLPIHAAGIYAPSESTPGLHTCLSDFAISSYTPTVRSLVERTRTFRETQPTKMGLLMISQPDTPKLARIPGTRAEVKAIKRLLDNHKIPNTCLESKEAKVKRVKNLMEDYTCIHFACHASQNTTEPLQSGFNLYDGRLELSSIIKEHLIGAELAFLSACQTSTGDEKLSEEAVHLAGGMLAAGYRGVVATMWSIKDHYGPKLADEFYKYLLSRVSGDEDGSKSFSSDDAARALHYATLQLRKTLDVSESALLTWVPFVHFGL